MKHIATQEEKSCEPIECGDVCVKTQSVMPCPYERILPIAGGHRLYVSTSRVHCRDCGAYGAEAGNRAQAIALWNVLPRRAAEFSNVLDISTRD